mgnify:CR=1 FL=1
MNFSNQELRRLLDPDAQIKDTTDAARHCLERLQARDPDAGTLALTFLASDPAKKAASSALVRLAVLTEVGSVDDLREFVLQIEGLRDLLRSIKTEFAEYLAHRVDEDV